MIFHRKGFLAVLWTVCTVALVPVSHADSGYDYPYADPYLASVSRALMNPHDHDVQTEEFYLRSDRDDIPWVEGRGKYSAGFYPGEPGAPLVVVVHGLGSHFLDSGAQVLAEAIHDGGFQVLSITNAFHWNHALTASQDGYPGYAPDDAMELYTAIIKTIQHLRSDRGLKFNSIELVGFSLGALQAAYLSKIDHDRRGLGFRRVVLINSPVDTLYGIRVLDQMFMTGALWPAKKQNEVQYRAFITVSNALETSDGHGSEFKDLDRKLGLSDDELKFLIGGSFRESLRDVIILSQQLKDLHILKSPADPWRRTPRETEALMFSYENYMNYFLLPMWMMRHGPSSDPQDMIRNGSLTSLEDYIRNNPEFYVITNEDDFLLRPTDVSYLRKILGNRLTLYPHGGHGGNLWFRRNQLDLLQILR